MTFGEEWTAAMYAELTPHAIKAARKGVLFFRCRAYRRGPFVPARIWMCAGFDPITAEPMDRSPTMQGELNGRRSDPTRIWAHGKPITEDDFRWMTATAAISKRGTTR